MIEVRTECDRVRCGRLVYRVWTINSKPFGREASSSALTLASLNVVRGRKLATRKLAAADVVEVVEGREGVEGVVVDCVDVSCTMFGRVETIWTGKHAGKDGEKTA